MLETRILATGSGPRTRPLGSRIGLRIALAPLVAGGFGSAQVPGGGMELFPNRLLVPPILQPTSTQGGCSRYDLTAHGGTTSFFAGQGTPTYGYNGMSYLGPTLRIRRGAKVRITLHNSLPEDFAPPMPMAMATSAPAKDWEALLVPYSTSIHFQGLIGPAAAAGIPVEGGSPLPSGQAMTGPIFTFDQPAATLWYQPLAPLDSGRQTYLGLGGLVILEDGRDRARKLPHDYGVDDLPLIVQDRRFGPDSGFLFRDRPEDADGMLGNRILVNGTLEPHADVPATRVRLRLVNASNARAYLFAFRDGRTFQQIATEGGLLPAPVEQEQILLPPGGRAEAVVDFSRDAGRRAYVVSRAFYAPPVKNPLALPNGGNFPLLEFRIGAPKLSRPLPTRLATLPPPEPGLARTHRIIELEQGGETGEGSGSETLINGKRYDPKRIDFRVSSGTWETWTVINHSQDMPHAFHVQGTPFRLLKRNGGPLTGDDQGWKDTIWVAPRETVQLLLHFDRQAGAYRFESQNLEALDLGMAGRYQVVRNDGAPR